LKQCNDEVALATESWKDCRRRVGLSFHYDTFGIEGMVGEGMVSSDFGGAADTWS
jgi:hypothetical protein